MNDTIYIRDLSLRTYIGIEDWERENKQDVLINISFQADLNAAGASDNIQDTVNYRTITKAVISLVETNRFDLVEKMATDIAKLVLKNDQVTQTTVTIDKPAALRFARSVAVQLTRSRSDFD